MDRAHIEAQISEKKASPECLLAGEYKNEHSFSCELGHKIDQIHILELLGNKNHVLLQVTSSLKFSGDLNLHRVVE